MVLGGRNSDRLYATFVFQRLWNRFLVPALNAGPISFWAVCGLRLFVELLMQHMDRSWAHDLKWEGTTKLLELCVLNERREELLAVVKQQGDEVWLNAGVASFSKIVGYSITFSLGWVVHTVLI